MSKKWLIILGVALVLYLWYSRRLTFAAGA